MICDKKPMPFASTVLMQLTVPVEQNIKRQKNAICMLDIIIWRMEVFTLFEENE